MKKSTLFQAVEKAKRIYESENGYLNDIYVGGSLSIFSILDSNKELLKQTLDVDLATIPYNVDFDFAVAGVMTRTKDFTKENGIEIDIVEVDNLNLPKNWNSRKKSEIYESSSGSINIHYINHHDLVFSKAIAGREKDWMYIEKLFEFNLVSPKKLNKIWKDEIKHQLKDDNKKRKLIADKLKSFMDKYKNKRSPSKKAGIAIDDEFIDSLSKQSSKKQEEHNKNNRKFKHN